MLRLITFGGVMLSRDRANIPWVQRGWQRGALFALLAAAGKRGVDREQLASLLWPDSADTAARHSLDELLSRARREVGSKELFVGTSFIALNSEVITTDLEEFERAVSNQHLERAVQLYEGPFAEGLRLSADDVERRLSGTRIRFAELFKTSLETLARRADERGDHAISIDYWQRAAREDPLSAKIAKAFVSALALAGERARAIAHIRVYRVLVREETGTEAPAEFLDLETQLRNASQDANVSDTPRADSKTTATLSQSNESLRERLLKRCIESSYILGEVIEQGSVVTRYQIKQRETLQPAELNVISIHVDGKTAERQFMETFKRVRSLSHPGLIPVFDMGVTEGVAYWMSAKQPTETLRDIMRRKQGITIEQAISYARAVAIALRHAHLHAISHGDLRPKRIGILDGRPMISGFGLVEAFVGRNLLEQHHSTAYSLGSPLYQSPEQLWDRAGADVASDIYAFGCITYELLSGEAPFGADAGIALVRRKLAGEVAPLRQLRNTISPEIESAVMQCLSRMPADRGQEVPIL